MTTPEVVEFDIGNDHYLYNIRADLKIDLANLDTEISQQPSHFAFISILSETLHKQLNDEQVRVSCLMKDYNDRIKVMEGTEFIDAKERGFTDGKAKEWVGASLKRRELFKEYLTVKEEEEKKLNDLELVWKKMNAFAVGSIQRARGLETLGYLRKSEMRMRDSIGDV